MTLARRKRAACGAKDHQERGHFPSDEAVIKPLRISEIGLASGCVGPTRTVTPSLGPIAVTSSCQAARSRWGCVR
jgi:hypothetical protein